MIKKNRKPQVPADYAQFRPGIIPSNDRNTRILHAHWDYSRERLDQIRNALTPLGSNHPDIHCLAAAGSFGRMEGSSQSDLDLVIIVHPHILSSAEKSAAIVNTVWQLLGELNLDRPTELGIFMKPVSLKQLVDPLALGNLDYPKHVFGLRMQLLLDAQAVYNSPALPTMTDAILDWYQQSPKHHALNANQRYLVADLIRYYRSYGVLHQFLEHRDNRDSWMLRQIKLYQSRLISYSALLLTVLDGTNSTTPDLRALNGTLTATPLERLWLITERADNRQVEIEYWGILQHYEKILSVLAEPGSRQQLIESPASTASQQIFDDCMNSATELNQHLLKFKQLIMQNWTPLKQSLLLC